jgi:hypothetical protein
MIPVCTTTNAGYNFFVFSGLSILVIEVKYDLGNAEERLNAIAQVIAESDGNISKTAKSIHTHTYQ